MKKKEFINLVSKIDQTFEDEFKGEYNSPELIWNNVIKPNFTKPGVMTSLYDNDESWDDVVSGYILENNFTKEQKVILEGLIKYLDKEYPDVFI
jgi:hypothetical protein